MAVSLESIKALREKTSASMKDVREALESSGGDESKALEKLRQRGAEIAQKRQSRATGQGRIESYVHHDGRLASIVEVQCETDFVARTPDFAEFCRNVAMQVASMSPRFVKKEDAPKDDVLKEDEVKLLCLLDQPFVKDAKVTIGDLLKLLIAKTGENILVKRFARFSIGDIPTVSP
jgi:elongation factor Ts